MALGELLSASRRIVRGDESDDDLALIFAPGSSLGGARSKASVVDPRGNLSIAKFPKDSDEYPVERWEAIALDIARAAGINTVEYSLLETNGRLVFISRRFDRDPDADDEGHRIPFSSAMAMTEHQDGDDDCSYLELVEVLNERGASPERDRLELFRRVAFNILVSNTDDHFRNHGFLWAGLAGWTLSPAYDINPTPASRGFLSTRIDFDEATASLELLRSVSEYFAPLSTCDQIIEDCNAAVQGWRTTAGQRGATRAEIKLMESAFRRQ